MKLKYNFVIRNVAGAPVAVAVGDGSENFNGMVKLNGSGEFIFNMLKNECTLNDIVAAVIANFDGIDSDRATEDVGNFIAYLRDSGLIEE